MADVTNKLDGALSGLLALRSGDELHFSCEVNNDSDRALRFANEAVTAPARPYALRPCAQTDALATRLP